MLKYSVGHEKHVCSPDAAARDCQFSPPKLTKFLARRSRRVGAGSLRTGDQTPTAPYQQARQHDGRIQIVGSDCKGSNPSSLPVSSGTPGKLINLSVPPFSHQPSEA